MFITLICLLWSRELRKIIDVHNCNRDFNVKLLNFKWLSKKIEKTFRENPLMKVMDIGDKFSRKWNICISKNMAFRTKPIAADNVDESLKEEYMITRMNF